MLHNLQMASSVVQILAACFCLFTKNIAVAGQPYSSILVINAAAGDPDAQVDLAECYQLGRGIDKNINETIRLLKQAAAKNNEKALIVLGSMYFNGEDVEKDPLQAETYMLAVAKRGNPIAQIFLGDMYSKGCQWVKNNIKVDKQKAHKWYSEAEKQGFYKQTWVDAEETTTPESSQILNYDPKNHEGDVKEIEEYYEKEKQKIISEGVKNIQKDLNNAMDTIATKAESLKKQTPDKILESEQRKITEDAENAYSSDLVQKAKAGDIYAQFNLGCCYYIGEGVAKDSKEAVKWLTKAAEKGHRDAQKLVGWCYFTGDAGTKDFNEAKKWLTKAAEQGDSLAQLNLGGLYYMNQDYKEAVKWYVKAADQGMAQGQFNLGSCYYNGHGVNQDTKEAIKWYTKAAEQGDDDAKRELETLTSR